MKTIAFSSETYLIKTTEITVLPVREHLNGVKIPPVFKTISDIVVYLDKEHGDAVIAGAEKLAAVKADFVPVRFAYASYMPFLAFFINLAKYVKRRFYTIFPSIYTTTLESLLANNVIRGERNEQNAYQWTNKKWQMSREAAHQRYQELYDSIKNNGYDAKSPMFIALNRKFGVKDQMVQGHHRIGICKELHIREVTISLWSVPRSYGFLKLFIPTKKH